MPPLSRHLSLVSLLSVLAVEAAAQCTSTFTNASYLAGTDAEVRALAVWDRDGTGPLPPSVVVAGYFAGSGSVVGNGIALFDPSTETWTDLAGGMSGVFLGAVAVHAVAVLPNGDLVAAGQFQQAGGVVATSIARWNGTAWSPFADGIGGYVYAMAVLPSGDLVAAGDFFLADGVYVDNLARWDGGSWQPLGAGLEGTVNALAVLPNGDLVAGGAITSSGAVPIARLARWDGVAWSELGGGLSGEVHAVAVHPSGDLYVGGFFFNAAGVGANGIVRRSGNAWLALGAGTTDAVRGIAFDGTGAVVACGSFGAAGGQSARRVARWNGSVWSPLGVGITPAVATARAVAVLPGGEIYVGGSFRDAAGVGSNHVRRFDGTNWIGLGVGTNGVVQCLLRRRDGTVFVGGTMPQIDDVPVNGVALWNGAQWLPIGSGLSAGDVRCCVELPNGDVVVGGQFSSISGVAAANVARWDGSTWHPLGPGLPGIVWALALRPGGQLVAGGAFTERVATWSGTNWIGTGVSSPFASVSPVQALAVFPSGDLVASGSGLAGGGLARWDGNAWSPFGSLTGAAPTMIATSRGEVLLGAGNQVLRSSGGTWTQVGGLFNGPITSAGMLRCLCELPNGDLLVGGSFESVINDFVSVPCPRLARFDGVAWRPVGTGANGTVRAVDGVGSLEILLGGEFSVVDGALAPRIARMGTTCPSAAVVVGPSCAGSGGSNDLRADSLPWLGSTFRSTALGMPLSGFAALVIGYPAAPQPLSSVVAEGLPGCELSTTQEIVALVVPSGGTLELAVPLPRLAGLVGLVIREQVVPIEFDASGTLTAVTASNALEMTLGWF